jgi:hypothetical protein
MERRDFRRGLLVACVGLALAGCETLRRSQRPAEPEAQTILMGDPDARDRESGRSGLWSSSVSLPGEPEAAPDSPRSFRRPSKSSTRPGALSDTAAEIEQDLGVH